MPFFILTHRPEDEPPDDKGFTFVEGLDRTIVLDHLDVRQSPRATHVRYAIQH